MNRAWEVDVTVPLDHTIDICSFVDVCFTAGRQTNPVTASGRTWVSQVNYRPDIYRGSWQGTWKLVKQTEGDGEAETGGLSGWGGTGQGYTGNAYYTGDNGMGPGWGSATGGEEYWCIEFFFASGDGGWQIENYFYPESGAMGSWSAGVGFVSATIEQYPGGFFEQLGISYDFGKLVTLTYMAVSGTFDDTIIGTQFLSGEYGSPGASAYAVWNYPSGLTGFEMAGETPVTIISCDMNGSGQSMVLDWMRLEGRLPAPFTATGNCTAGV